MKRKVKQLEDDIEQLNVMRKSLDYEKTEREKELEEERRKRIEAEKKAQEAKEKEQHTKLKAYAVDDLMRMDLSNAKPRDIKDKMEDLGISHVGCTSREDLLKKLAANVPSLKDRINGVGKVRREGRKGGKGK